MHIEIIPGFAKAVNEGLRDIHQAVKSAGLQSMFSAPVSIGWKVASFDELQNIVSKAADSGVELIYTSKVDDRYIATMLLPDQVGGMSILKILQRHVGSDDLLGLDHIDFRVDNIHDSVMVITTQSSLKAKLEFNDAHKWISVDCAGREAKLIDHDALDVASAELQKAALDLQQEA